MVIVGSGLAGLTLGALLARSGRPVRILEAHERFGGYGHTFPVRNARGAWSFNAQLHYVWNCGPGETVDRFLDAVGLRGAVAFGRYDPDGFDRMRMPGHALDVPSDPERLIQRLADGFPAHAGALRAFVEEALRTDAALRAWPPGAAVLRRPGRFLPLVRWRRATLGDVFEAHGLPPAARTLLASQWPDFLEAPARLSFFAWAMLFCGYLRGAYYPERHFEHVTDSIVSVIRAHGGEVLARHTVLEYLREGRAIVGVRVATPDGVRELRAPVVVCNADPRAAAESIGLEHFSREVRARLQYTYSASSFVVYTSVEGLDLRAHGFGRHNTFHTEDPDLDAAFHRMRVDGDYSRPSFAITTPSLLGALPDAPPGHQILQLLTVADHRSWSQLALDDPRGYARRKRAVADQLLQVVERRYVPGLRDHLALTLIGSPTTSERYVRAPAGNAYGSALIPSQVGPGRLDARTSLDGFWFCNASSGYPGFAGTVWTGCRLFERLTGERVLG